MLSHLGAFWMNNEELMAFAKSKGFFWPSADMYGGAAGIYDYGHLGALMKRRFEHAWLSYFVEGNNDYYLIDGSNILPERPLVASGHASRFNDILIGCAKCHTYYRADVLLADLGIKVSEGASQNEIDELVKKNGVKCPKDRGELLPSKAFNMMIDLALGPDRSDRAYLRPETAQSAYMNFFREFNVLRKTLPMGLAVIGRAYRNEISPRQGLYRLRELIQAELQIFFDPENFPTDPSDIKGFKKLELSVIPYKTGKLERLTAGMLVKEHGYPEFYVYHMALIDNFYKSVLGVPEGRIRFLEKGGKEKAFYNKLHMDIEIDIESWGGYREVAGLHYREDYDLNAHSKGAKVELAVTVGTRRVVPHVLELSFGVDRNMWMLIDSFYTIEGDRKILKLKPWISPFSAAILPLQKEDRLELAVKNIKQDLKGRFKVFFDDSGSIGRRYARMDEIGTPFCMTIDFDSIDEKSKDFGTVTVRERDSKKQERIKIEDIASFLEANRTYS